MHGCNKKSHFSLLICATECAQRKTLATSFHNIKRLKSRRERERAHTKRAAGFEALEIGKIRRCCCLQIQKDELFLYINKFCMYVHFSFDELQNTRLIKRLQFAFLVCWLLALPLYLRERLEKIKSFSSQRLATTKRTQQHETRSDSNLKSQISP